MRPLAVVKSRWAARTGRAIAALMLGLTPAAAAAPTPAAAVGATVSSVTFRGTVDAPTITIAGSGFGAQPTGTIACLAGNGADGSRNFGASLYLHDSATPGYNAFDAGRNGGAYCDTIGLIIDSYTDTQVVVRPGSDYLNLTWNWRFREGDPFYVGIAGFETPTRSVTYAGPIYYASVNGTAACAGTSLPGARVDLFSGGSIIATTTADSSGVFSFGVAPASYTLRYTSASGLTVCGGPVTVASGATVSAPAAAALIDLHNHSWPSAYRLALGPGMSGSLVATADEHIARQDQSTWFKFSVQPGSRVVVTLTNLPATYNLTLYKDIGAAFASAASPRDITRLSAEFAPDAFSPDAFSPDAFSPDAFSPDAFSPDAFSPDAFSPDAFSPDAFSPDAFSPDAFSPDAFSPDAFSPDAFSPDAFSPDAFSPDAFSPDAFSGGETVVRDAFSSAQTRSVLSVSAFSGTASQGIVHNTWDNTSDFYVRVRGHNGAFSLAAPFRLTVTELTGACAAVGPVPSSIAPTLGAGASGLKTLVLTNLAAMPGTAAEKASLSRSLATFVARPEIGGAVVDVVPAADARIRYATDQANTHAACPYAKNVLAGEIKRLVDAYRAANTGLQYVVLVGGDAAIPFFRHPDQAGLAGERDFSPPVLDASPSQADLKGNYVLGQDRYGAAVELSINDHSLPLPGLAVGRLVETAADADGVLGAYLSTSGGRVPASSSLVTGYDFLARPANAIRDELAAGTGAAPDALIQSNTVPPTAPSAWTGTQLKSLLLGGARHDLVFLGGHFSATSALAADFSTRVLSTDLLGSGVDFTNALVFSAGCHSGYNIVDGEAVPNVTASPDWPQAFARKKATLIAGTGYQYGDTDVIEYSTRLYLEFSRQLRTGSGPVPVGKALVAAKRAYLAKTAQLRGIHEKSLLETTLYGLPQLAIDEPGARLSPPSDTPIVGGSGAPVVAYTAGPGRAAPAGLGLAHADVSLAPSLARQDVPLSPAPSSGPTSATAFVGPDGQVVNPAEPVLPLALPNVTGPSGTVLRGVGFRSGSYSDLPRIRPLTGAPATELRVPHAPFFSSVPYPIQLWRANYFDAVNGGATHLAVTPAQFVSDGPGSPTGSLRTYSALGLRLYYSGHTGPSALAAAPAISRVSAVPSADGRAIALSVDVGGDPGAGIQEVWVTYTATSGPLAGRWQSVDLAGAARPYSATNPSTRWTATLGPADLGGAANVRFVVQAANGNGVVGLATNRGAFYTPGPVAPPMTTPKQGTSLALSGPTVGRYRDAMTYSATLTNTADGSRPANRVLTFGFGAVRHVATTGPDGSASVSLPLLSPPGSYDVRVSFDEANDLLGSSATGALRIDPQDTSLAFDVGSATAVAGGPIPIGARLRDASSRLRALVQQPIYFVATGGGLTRSAVSVTDFVAGRALAPPLALPAGTYRVSAAFGGVVDLGNGQSVDATDPRYNASRASSATLTVTADPATAVYTGPTTLRVGGTLALAATVAAGPGSPLTDLNLASIQFTVLGETGAVVQSVTAPVSAAGAASAAMTGLPVGVYTLATSVTGGYFASPPARTTLAVYDPGLGAGGAGLLSTTGPAAVCPAPQSLPYTCGLPDGQSAGFAFGLAYPSGATLPAGLLRLQVGQTFSLAANADPRNPSTPPGFDWLVVTPNRVQFQGTGTVNGTAGPRFRADGRILGNGRFSFEIRIWKARQSYDAPTYALGSVIVPQETEDDPVGGIVIRRISGG